MPNKGRWVALQQANKNMAWTTKKTKHVGVHVCLVPVCEPWWVVQDCSQERKFSVSELHSHLCHLSPSQRSAQNKKHTDVTHEQRLIYTPPICHHILVYCCMCSLSFFKLLLYRHKYFLVSCPSSCECSPSLLGWPGPGQRVSSGCAESAAL